MQHRKQFIKTIGVGFSGLALVPKIILGSSNSENSASLIVLDSVRRNDLIGGLPKTMDYVSNFNTTIFDNLYTTANLDFHEDSFLPLFRNSSFISVDVLRENKASIATNNILLTCFDVAHYNIDLYHNAIANADELIVNLLTNNASYSQFTIMSSSGRNNFNNQIVNESGIGGIDHNHESAKECFAIKVSNGNAVKSNITYNSTRINTSKFHESIV
jgi:hypothetical protein